MLQITKHHFSPHTLGITCVDPRICDACMGSAKNRNRTVVPSRWANYIKQRVHDPRVPRKYRIQGLEIKAQTKPGISLLARVLEDPTLSTTPKISSKELLAEVVVIFWQMEVICGKLLWPCLS